jgi:diguanylate cyclase (GGDEF)-like protein
MDMSMAQVPIVVPAFFLSAGIVLYTGIQATVVGIVGHRVPNYLAFAATCFCAAGFQIASAVLYLADSVPMAAAATRWQNVFICLFLPAFFFFTLLYTGQQRRSPWLSIVILISAALLVGNVIAPYSLRFDTLEMAAPLVLPWGESLAQFDGEPGLGHGVFRVFATIVLLWALWRTTVQFRRGDRRPALFMASCVLLIIAASIWGALIDFGLIRSFYPVGFAFLGLAALMSVCLGLDLRDRNMIVELNNDTLKKEIGVRREAERKLETMANQDYLTGLANRMSLHSHLTGTIEAAAGAGRHGAMLLIDLDHFKTINDALSHDVGDQVLQEIARRLTSIAGQNAFIARLGGDEFVAVVAPESADEAGATALATRLAESITSELSAPLAIGERVLNVGASIGIAPFPANGQGASDILRHGDMALYRAKKLGRNNIQFYAAGMQAVADERLKLERGLRMALSNDELSLHFQPQVDSAGRFIGAEALLRWRHPQGGMIPPMSFIPVAEETGLIHAIGSWVFDTACERLKVWRQSETGFRGDLSVNVSAWQFARPDFIKQMEFLLTRHGLGCDGLTLELTESALLFDVAEAIEKLQALRAMGIKISLDDFGTGYSSLAYLRSLPLDCLKIDQRFVQELASDSETPLAEDIIAIGRRARLQVIAEGVETPIQHKRLQAMGCEQFQGYLFSRPLPEKEFLIWLAGNALGTDSAMRTGSSQKH